MLGGAEKQRPVSLVRRLSRTAPALTPLDLLQNIDADLEFDYSSLNESTDLTGRLADPDLPWTAGSVPAMPLNEVVLVHTSVGATLLDSLGSPHSFIARSAVERMGQRGVRLTREPQVFGGEGTGSAIHGKAEFTAAFLLTIHVSYQEPAHRVRDVGPF